MDAVEAKVRCLELAATLLRPGGIPTGRDVVEIATVMYSFVNAQPAAPETERPATPDKPMSGRRGQAQRPGPSILD